MTDRERVASEPCECEFCDVCNGNGTVRVNQIDSEECPECDGARIVKTCDRCVLLEDMDHDDRPS